MGAGGQLRAQAALPPGKANRYPYCRRLSGRLDLSGRVRNISSRLGFDPRTVQSVVSRYIDCAIPSYNFLESISNHRSSDILIVYN
jgi:hypothetical protein